MFSYLTNSETVLLNELLRIKQFRESLPNILALGAEATRAAVLRRIQSGQNSAGQSMRTRFPGGYDPYSNRHGKFRSLRGLQTDHIDFKVTGAMLENWSVRIDGESVALGFSDPIQTQKAADLESYFGAVFTVTDQEFAAGDELIDNRTTDLL